MVATVGSISIDLSTNAAKFATGFKSAATTVETQSGRMARSIAAIEKNTALAGATLKNFGAGLAAGVGLAAIASLGGAFEKLKQTIAEYDEIATNAKTTGLNSDTYQALAFAAKQANISQESYNSALNIFAKNAGLAAIGQGALFSGLKKLNPQLLQNILNTKDQEERLKLVADAMARTSDATQKAALSAAIFGKGGVEISRILENGRASIDRFKQTALEMGIIIPEDLLQRAGELDDKLDVLSSVINSQFGQALINLAPILVGATQGFADFSRELNAFSVLVANFKANPSLENFLKLLDEERGTKDEGFLTKMIENYSKAFAEFGKIFNDATTNTSDEATQAIAANIRYLEDLLANLKQAAAEGQDVKLETDDATAKLHALQAELVTTQAVGVSAANAISAAFAQAFRESENASMVAFAAMQKTLAGASTTNLPNVTRYGGDPNKITLPDQRSSVQENANNSGVNVTRFGGMASSDEFQRKTVDNTEDTADNVDQLDRNTKGYLESLSQDIGEYSAQQIQAQNVVINKLSDVTAETFGMLSSAILASVVAGSGPGSDGTSSGGDYLFGDEWDPRFGSIVSGRGYSVRPMGKYQISPTSDDGSFDTSVQVAQPGSNITLNYTAAKGESEGTARQNARAMFDELLREAARA